MDTHVCVYTGHAPKLFASPHYIMAGKQYCIAGKFGNLADRQTYHQIKIFGAITEQHTHSYSPTVENLTPMSVLLPTSLKILALQYLVMSCVTSK